MGRRGSHPTRVRAGRVEPFSTADSVRFSTPDSGLGASSGYTVPANAPLRDPRFSGPCDYPSKTLQGIAPLSPCEDPLLPCQVPAGLLPHQPAMKPRYCPARIQGCCKIISVELLLQRQSISVASSHRSQLPAHTHTRMYLYAHPDTHGHRHNHPVRAPGAGGCPLHEPGRSAAHLHAHTERSACTSAHTPRGLHQLNSLAHLFLLMQQIKLLYRRRKTHPRHSAGAERSAKAFVQHS